MRDDKITVRTDAAAKDKELPEYQQGLCPKCNGPTHDGFGLAGGGYGVYTYCEACNEVVSKSEVDD